jgi:hypothetical protein
MQKPPAQSWELRSSVLQAVEVQHCRSFCRNNLSITLVQNIRQAIAGQIGSGVGPNQTLIIRAAWELLSNLIASRDTPALRAPSGHPASGANDGLTDILYQRDREIIAFARPDLAVSGTGSVLI